MYKQSKDWGSKSIFSSYATVDPVKNKHQTYKHWWRFYVGVVNESETWPKVVQFKSKHSYKPWLGL